MMIARAWPVLLIASFTLASPHARAPQASDTSVSYQAKGTAGQGKHVVFLAGDEEYRSEEGLPMLAKILSQRHGFRTTVLFSVAADGTIDPDKSDSLSHSESLDSADCVVMLLRFRRWPDDIMKRFETAIHRGI